MAITLHKGDGFEHGVISTYTLDVAATASPTIVTANHRSGSRGVEMNPVGTTEFISYNTAFTVVTVAFFVRFSSLPTATGNVIARVRGPANNLILDWDNGTSQMRIRAGAGTQQTGGPVITTGQYYRVVMEYDTSGSTFAGRVVINTSSEMSTTVAGTAGNCTDASLGATSASTYTAIFDDLVICSANGDYEQIRDTWSDWEILSAIPTADGTHNITTAGDMDSFTSTAFSNSTTNGHTFIGHRPLQAANTANQVIRQDLQSATTYMELLFENPSNTHPNVGGVQTHAGHVMSSATGTPTAEARLMLSDSTEVLTTGSQSVIEGVAGDDPGITLAGRKRAAIAPSGGWDETKVDGLKIRIGFNNIAADVNFVDLMLQVVYFAQAGGSLPPFRSDARNIITNIPFDSWG